MPIHLFWTLGVTVNEWLQFLRYKSQVLAALVGPNPPPNPNPNPPPAPTLNPNPRPHQVLAEFMDHLRKTRWWSWDGLVKVRVRAGSPSPSPSPSP